MKEKDKIPTFYKILKIWANIYHDKLFYRKTYYLNTENIPPAGTPLIIVCNHQNSLNDAMGIVISLDLRYPHFLARADIFKRPFIAKVLRFFGLLPVYRQCDGMANVKINLAIFENVVNYIKRGNTLAMYPEAGHQDKHYLGKFFLSYTRLAFDTAASSNFEKEVFILPCANHYTDYFGWREEMMMTYGKPLSIKPYYELYKTQPRQVQEKINEIIRAEIESMMLNITDLENYDAIYFLLQTYGKKFAVKNNLNPNKLPQ
ncbi:MAG TPA: 1-acyl-sn-glycerol-3-phosphate acyltransferase, partial [Bacteroidales bacterium]|nr:1-acyl-sn-glycerol-3-phosphate acyltransferase [Bacteroidales bacterium]